MKPSTSGNPPILVAEDEEADVFLLNRARERAEIPNPLVCVTDGEGIVQYLTSAPPFHDRARHPFPGLILLDLKMPRMTGFEVLAWVKARPEFHHIPIVVLTSSNHGTDRQQAMELGAKQYLVKPTSITELIPMLKELHAQWLGADPAGGTQPGKLPGSHTMPREGEHKTRPIR
jgi:CheY-like chemotaxis protein